MKKDDTNVIVLLPEEEYLLFIAIIQADMKMTIEICLDGRVKKDVRVQRLIEVMMDYQKIICLTSPVLTENNVRQFIYSREEACLLSLIIDTITKEEVVPELHPLYDKKYPTLKKVFDKAKNIMYYDINMKGQGLA